MKKKIFEFIRQIGIFFGVNIQVNRWTNYDELESFLQKLYPIKTDKKLIRVGAEKDGGYIIPDDMDNIKALFSPGVGSKQDFDLECANNGIQVFMADASVDGAVENHKNYVFTKKFIGTLNNEEYISIENWIKQSNVNEHSDLLLQMDIEGYEYETIYSMSQETLNRFRIIIIEFHELDLLLNKAMFEKLKNSFLKILETHYVVHIHPNNCCKSVLIKDIAIPPVLEFTFIRKDRVEKKGYVSIFPNLLDANCSENNTLVLPQCWYKSKWEESHT